jgi:predicted ATPase
VTGEPVLAQLSPLHRYHRQVFLAPPWPDIHVIDEERRHGLSEATTEYEHLVRAFPALGYQIVLLPKVSVVDRAELVLRTLEDEGSSLV